MSKHKERLELVNIDKLIPYTNNLTTSSARKAFNELMVGKRIDVWNDNSKKETIYYRNKEDIQKYIKLEKKYIMLKQKKRKKEMQEGVR